MNPLELAKKHPIATGGIIIVLLLLMMMGGKSSAASVDKPTDAEIASQTQIAIATLNAQQQSGALAAQLQMMGMQFALQREELGVNREIGLAGLAIQKESLAFQKDLGMKQLQNDVDLAKINADVAKYNSKQSNKSLFSRIFSDARLKHNITRVGTHKSGAGLYAYEYVWGGGYTVGVLAQEYAQYNPGAVSRHETGFLMVDARSL